MNLDFETAQLPINGDDMIHPDDRVHHALSFGLVLVDLNGRIIHESVKFCQNYDAGKQLLDTILSLEPDLKKLLKYDTGMSEDIDYNPDEFIHLKCSICEKDLVNEKGETIVRDHNHYRLDNLFQHIFKKYM